MSESQLEVYQQCGEITEGINDSLQKLSSNLSALTQTFDRTSTLLDSWIGLCGNAPQHAVPPPAPKPEVQRQAAPELMPSPVKARQVPFGPVREETERRALDCRSAEESSPCQE